MQITRLVLGALAPFAIAFSVQAAEPSSGTTAPDGAGGARTVEMGPAVRDAQGREGRVHTVVRGDTLWDISEAYLGSPLAWPSVWKNNPGVANPNRIYPGNQIWISANEMRPLSKDEAASIVPLRGAGSEDAGSRVVGSFPVPELERIGFVTPDELETAGELIGSPEDELQLAAHRRAFVTLGEGEVRPGDEYTIVRRHERVRDPETNDTLGYHVEKLGWLEITRVGPQSSEAIIRVATAEIERGDRLVPRIVRSIEIPMRRDPIPVQGQIAFIPEKRTIVGQKDFLFLNRGVDDGLEVGAMLEIFRPGEVIEDRVTGVEHALPDESIANLIVVGAGPNTAVALTTSSWRELVRGDPFRTVPSLTTSHRESLAPLEGAQWTARTIEGRNEGLPPTPAKQAPPAGK